MTLIGLLGFSACHSNQTSPSNLEGTVLVSRIFPTLSWERFDFVEEVIEVKEPVTYNLALAITFAPDTATFASELKYPFDYFEMCFTVFDENGNHRGKKYKFPVKDRNGEWKTTPTENGYHFTFPINNELTLNEPGKYKFQIENCMPKTPLLGIKEIALIDKIKNTK